MSHSTHPVVAKIIEFVSQLDYENGPADLSEIMPQGDVAGAVEAISEHLGRDCEFFGGHGLYGNGVTGPEGYEWRVEEDDYAVTLDVYTDDPDDASMDLSVFVC